MSWWAYVAAAVSTIICMILTINSKRQQRLDSDQEEEKEDCGDVVNDVAANTQEGFWDECPIVPANQKTRRRPRQQTKRR